MNAPLKILISGQHGQVSRELQQRLQGLGELIVLGRDQLDLAQPEQIRLQVRAHRPGLIINAAAHTAGDQAESEPQAAFAHVRDAAQAGQVDAQLLLAQMHMDGKGTTQDASAALLWYETAANNGAPIWSATMRICGFSCSRRCMVSRKFLPWLE